jgi:hypothetical protein
MFRTALTTDPACVAQVCGERRSFMGHTALPLPVRLCPSAGNLHIILMFISLMQVGRLLANSAF